MAPSSRSKQRPLRAPAPDASPDPFRIDDEAPDDGPSGSSTNAKDPTSSDKVDEPAAASSDSSLAGPKPPPKDQTKQSNAPANDDEHPWGQPQGSNDDAEAVSKASYQPHQQISSLSADKATSNPIEIIEALKSSDGAASSTFIVYLIRSGSFESKRRYSEFEALRTALVALHPTCIVPPLPPKHTLSDYAAGKSKAKEDPEIIGRRRRMLATFLNRVASHDTLGKSIVLQRFLDGRWQWHEVAASPPLSILPRHNLRAPAKDPADPNASPAYLALPLPTSTTPLRNPNQRFIDSEAFTNRFANHISNSLEKANRRVVRRWGESAQDYLELGAVLNGFSLSESGSLAAAIEKTGQAADGTNLITGAMLQEWETRFTEPLHEYTQYASILQKLLKWRHLKHLQYELAEDALEAKRLKLGELERVEAEANRLNTALESGGKTLMGPGLGGGGGGAKRGEGIYDSVNARTLRSSVFGGAAEEWDEEASSRDLGRAVSSPGVSAGGAGSGGGAGTASGSGTAGSAAGRADLTDSTSSVTSAGGGKSVAAEHLGDSADWTVPSAVPSPPSLTAPTSRNGASHAASQRGRGGFAQQPGAGMGHPSTASLGGAGGPSGLVARAASGARRSTGGGGLLGALSHTFQSVMDVDPEATRRSNIGKLRENIAQLDEALQLTAADLRYSTAAIQTDLDRFQKQKVLDFKEMMLNFARMHREFCRANLANWEEAKTAIDAIAANDDVPATTAVGASSSAATTDGGGVLAWHPYSMPESNLLRAHAKNR